jgi:hypothetical protein
VSGDSFAALTIFQFSPWGPNPAPIVNPIDPKKLAWIVLSGMLE